MKISVMAAMAQNRVIGKNNQLPWSLPADLKRFKTMTMGHPCIMGRKTFESMGRPLPKRDNLIISRQKNYTAAGAFVFHSVEEALAWCRARESQPGFEEVFLIGGAEIWNLGWSQVDRIYLTVIHRDVEGDTFFPEFRWDDFNETFREEHRDVSDELPFTYLTLERKAQA